MSAVTGTFTATGSSDPLTIRSGYVNILAIGGGTAVKLQRRWLGTSTVWYDMSQDLAGTLGQWSTATGVNLQFPVVGETGEQLRLNCTGTPTTAITYRIGQNND